MRKTTAKQRARKVRSERDHRGADQRGGCRVSEITEITEAQINANARMLVSHLTPLFGWHDNFELQRAVAERRQIPIGWVKTDKAAFAFVGLMENRAEGESGLVLPRKHRYQLWVKLGKGKGRDAQEVGLTAARLAKVLGAPDSGTTVHRGAYDLAQATPFGRQRWELGQGRADATADGLYCYEWPYVAGSDVQLGLAVKAGT